MIADEKLQAFVQKAAEMWAAGRPERPSPGADPPGSLYSDQVFIQLRWRAEDKRYFQDDGDNLLRELEYQGAVVIWNEGGRPPDRGDPAWLVSTFTLTDKGRGQARRVSNPSPSLRP